MTIFVASVAGVIGASLVVFSLLIWRAPGETYPGQFDRSARTSEPEA